MGKIILLLLLTAFLQSDAKDIYVAVNGNDSNPGTAAQPVATLQMALRKARELRRTHDIDGAVHIILKGGTYFLSEPVFIRPEDAGTVDSPTLIEAAEGEKPVLSGGMLIRGWKPLKSSKIWFTDAPGYFRQLWVNNRKAVKAQTPMQRILSWNHQAQQCWIPAKGLNPVPGMEMVIHQWWAIAILRIKSAEVHGDSALLSFYQPESRIQSEHPWPAPWISKESGNSAFYLSDALQFLDKPGEWYLDRQTHKLYYWPREDEHISEAVAPVLETLVKFMGTPDQPVEYITFKGIGFQHSGWLRPGQQGHVPLQAGMYLLDAYKLPVKKGLENQAWVSRPVAAVEASYTQHTAFESCRFEHLAATGLDYQRGNHHDRINGNLFKDIGGTGIQLGVFSDEAFEAHLPYLPTDLREVTSHTTITNNLITDVTNEDWGTLGIAAGFVKDALIAHNEISDVNYSGISVGWGWTKSINAMSNNRIIANRIHHYAKQMYDVAGIYTLSAQPGSVISNNEIDSIYKAPFAHLPVHWFYLYTDEGTSYYTVKNNWCPEQKFLQNANGPNNVWENNGPQVADSVRQQAGLESAYRYLQSEKAAHSKQPINHRYPTFTEVISDQPIDGARHWKNHYFFIDNIVKGKVYDAPFYVYDRSHCEDTTTARGWSYTVMTADLVDDPVLQQEYMDYHATQFERWPEISKGFCNADFQQLLLYRNGRQLLLVIAIPKGESLDQLNPKTTENNPRVTEWNTIMKKYQQGIPGTSTGEVWVELK